MGRRETMPRFPQLHGKHFRQPDCDMFGDVAGVNRGLVKKPGKVHIVRLPCGQFGKSRTGNRGIR
jgi:hypothetical protein